MSTNKKGALFVCLGNTCRSPIAEAVFTQTVKERGERSQWNIDSAGIENWHFGQPPNSRALVTLKAHNISYKHKARQIMQEDYNTFDFIFAMDEKNMQDLKTKAPTDSKAKLLLLGDFDPEGDRIIRDPYYDSGSEGFKRCYKQCVRSCAGFLSQFEKGEI